MLPRWQVDAFVVSCRAYSNIAALNHLHACVVSVVAPAYARRRYISVSIRVPSVGVQKIDDKCSNGHLNDAFQFSGK